MEAVKYIHVLSFGLKITTELTKWFVLLLLLTFDLEFITDP